MIEKNAEVAGVACDVVYERNDSPYEAIIRVAEHRGCDLIMMASHGRRGVGALLIGSETQKVLTHSENPRAGVPLNVGDARCGAGLRYPGRGNFGDGETRSDIRQRRRR